MADNSAIEWTEATWNPVTGCNRVSPGCAHCYALTLAKRLKAMGNPRYQQDGEGRSSGPGFGVTLHGEVLVQPQRWRRPRRVFVNSMSDLFHEEIPNEFIAAVFGVMATSPEHTFQVLTKRPERMRAWFDWHTDQVCQRELQWEPWRVCQDEALEHVPELPAAGAIAVWPLPNVWLGVSIENRRFVHRADLLRETPTSVRFISAEPLLGPLIAPNHVAVPEPDGDDRAIAVPVWDDQPGPGGPAELDLTGIDWLIVGGESGPRHRPLDERWVRDLRDAAAAQGIPFFFKQWGGRTPKAGGRKLDDRTWDEYPVTSAAAEALQIA